MAAKIYERTLERRAEHSLKCECGGYCDEADLTDDEYQHGCSKDTMFKLGCCVKAFVCCLCKQRWVARLEAPEYR